MKRAIGYCSIVRRSADWASAVSASASSRKMILKAMSRAEAVRANSLILPRTIPMPRSSEAFSSRSLFVQSSPYSSRARASAHVVLPTPAGPANMRCGMLFVDAYALRRSTISGWPTTSPSFVGRYFSTQISSIVASEGRDDYNGFRASRDDAEAAVHEPVPHARPTCKRHERERAVQTRDQFLDPLRHPRLARGLDLSQPFRGKEPLVPFTRERLRVGRRERGGTQALEPSVVADDLEDADV